MEKEVAKTNSNPDVNDKDSILYTSGKKELAETDKLFNARRNSGLQQQADKVKNASK